MKTKEDYEDVWQQADFNQKVEIKALSGHTLSKAVQEETMKMLLTVKHRVLNKQEIADSLKKSESKTAKA